MDPAADRGLENVGKGDQQREQEEVTGEQRADLFGRIGGDQTGPKVADEDDRYEVDDLQQPEHGDLRSPG